MTLGARDSGVRRILIGRKLRLHDRVAGGTAEFDRFRKMISLISNHCTAAHKYGGAYYEHDEGITMTALVEIDIGPLETFCFIAPLDTSPLTPHAEWYQYQAEYENRRQDHIEKDTEIRIINSGDVAYQHKERG